MKILVTGGAGFMGSNVVRYFLEKYPSYHIVNFDKLTYAGNLENLRDVTLRFGDRYQFIQGDIADAKDISGLEGDFDAIINFAAETHVDRSIINPEAFLFTDVVGTYRLLEFVRTHTIPRFIQISTDEVFGSITEGEFTESSPFEPNSPYAASKAGGDLLCRSYVVTYGTPVIVTHSCNFYGPYQYPEKLIPLFITNLIEGKRVPVYGKGDQVREWIFTEDYCRALDTIMHHGAIGEVYNIGTGERRQNIEITKAILTHMGKDEVSIEYIKDRPGHDIGYAVNATKLRRLGWKPQVRLSEGLLRTVEWYRLHEDWWRPLKSGAYLTYYKQQYEQR